MKTTISALILLVGGIAMPTTGSENWPQWRGPQRNGVSNQTGLPSRWTTSENVVWRLALPETSGSTPIIWDDHVFLNVAQKTSLSLWAISRLDGAILWQRPLDDRNQDMRKGNMSSPSPVTDGRSVWVMTGTGVLTGFDFQGNRLWQRDLQEEYGPFGILHGYSSSPLLHDGTLYVQVLHGFHTDDPSYVLGIDASTGKNRWRVERPTDAPKEAPDAYTTPALLEVGGTSTIVVSGADYVTGHDPDSGREVWRVGGLNPTQNPMQRIVASPVVVGDKIFVPSRVRPLLALVATDGADHQPEVVWSMDRGPDVPSPVVDDRYVYLLNDKGILWCLDANSGDAVWGPERISSAIYSASPLLADGKLYATSEQGRTTVINAGPEFEIVAENDLDEYTLASMAAASGQLFLRTAEHLYCLDEKD
jgi:outer membrane protein assembly factor BamB